MGRTLLQTGRIVMMIVWMLFTIVAWGLALRQILGVTEWLGIYPLGFDLLAGYAGLGMATGLGVRFIAERERAEAEKFIGI